MASFISANRKHEMQHLKMLAQIGYSGGMVASTALAKRRPRFEDIFVFPKDTEQQYTDVERSRANMLIWAENMNRLSRKNKKENK